MWSEVDAFSWLPGQYVLRSPLVLGGDYIFVLVGEPVTFYGNWLYIHPADFIDVGDGSQRVTIGSIAVWTPRFRTNISAPPAISAGRRLGYFFPQRQVTERRTIAVYRFTP